MNETSEPIEQGDRVETKQGPGEVAYVRMAPPEFSRPQAVSVVLDAKRGTLGYAGTIFAAAEVRKVGA
jgi:hypothetical protein